MTRFLIRALVWILSSLLGLLAAKLLLPGFHLSTGGLILAVIVFAILPSLLAPLVVRLTRKYASALIGGVGLVTTFISLLITSLLPGGLSIDGFGTWALGTFIVWIVTALATWLLPGIMLREKKPEGTKG